MSLESSLSFIRFNTIRYYTSLLNSLTSYVGGEVLAASPLPIFLLCQYTSLQTPVSLRKNKPYAFGFMLL